MKSAVSNSFPISPQRILVRGVNWLGDAVMTTPAMLHLRRRFPSASITLMGPEKLGELWWQHPAVDEVLMIGSGEKLLNVAKQVRRGNYDLGILFPNSPRSALELWLGKVPRRVGYRARWRSAFLTDAVPSRPEHRPMVKRSPNEIRSLVSNASTHSISTGNDFQTALPTQAHHLYHYLHLVAQLGGEVKAVPPQLEVTDREVESFRDRFLSGQSSPEELLLGLNAGAEYGPAKRWPEERFVEAALAISRVKKCRWIVFGGKGDIPLAERITQKLQSQLHAGGIAEKSRTTVVNVAGKTGLRELMSGLRACRVLITNDTGPMHVAAAMGTPVVVPFGSTSPELTAPGLPGEKRHRFLVATAPCRPCFLRECPIDFRCMQEITVARVVEAVLELLPS